ncbi:hypothetical protein FA15DRAFT_701826 [Coprinopsis marcescibilis]|uniref:Protein kinase domain-containing protein n=1 Tax=Coprinopsis marcescibilis TaxID=230819 RepID=A0A5C3L658_COPMA|nr:hypothetical protein FA15DRAFT_701826 [Coprinopsis marcescibilis]
MASSSSSSRTSSPAAPSPAHDHENADVFSLSDDTVSRELDFIEEIGNGNWGSVWLVRPKRSRSGSEETAFKAAGRKFAVKVVHRKKTAANASRLKSLWNEMKIVRSLKQDSHPSIIPFHSFVITPGLAMITMTYLPTQLPVEVEESKAREWFRFLLSAVDFLHKRGVVHNDIKPANILLSHKNVPVLVDYGFAEKNDADDDTSFHSNLAYGTPEYLSPERARGLTHDTRKSDVWSLGVTFFEILNGRTPFEESDGKSFQTKEDVEKYWSRTLRGKWIGKWDASPPMERLLRRMMSPNADLRCTAAQALADGYWQVGSRSRASQFTHHRSSSAISSIVFEKDLDKLLNMTPPSAARIRRTTDGRLDDPLSPPGLDQPAASASATKDDSVSVSAYGRLVKSKSQPKVAVATSKTVQSVSVNRRRPHIAPMMDLSPIKASPPTSPTHVHTSSANAKENLGALAAQNRVALASASKNKEKEKLDLGACGTPAKARKILGITDENMNVGYSVSGNKENTSVNESGRIRPPAGLPSRIPIKKLDEMTVNKRGSRAGLGKSHSNLSLTKGKDSNSNLSSGVNAGSVGYKMGSLGKSANNVKDRVMEWEREKQRLREMERLEELERERDEHFERQKERRKERREVKEGEKREREARVESEREKDEEEENDNESREGSHEEAEVVESAPVDIRSNRPSTVNSEDEEKDAARLKRMEMLQELQRRKEENQLLQQFDFERRRPASPPTLPLPPPMSPLSRMMNTFPAPTPNNTFAQSPEPAPKQPKQNIFKHGIKASIDKTVQSFKNASIGKATGLAKEREPSTAGTGRGFSFDILREAENFGSKVYRESRDEGRRAPSRNGLAEEVATPLSPTFRGSITSAVSPIGPIRNAAMTDQAAAETQMDRMALWMRNVEQVVEEAQANFEAMAPQDFSLPALPVPLSRSQSRTRPHGRLPRRVLAASQIFDENGQPSANSSFNMSADASGLLSPSQPSQYQAPPPPSSFNGRGTPRRHSESSEAQEVSVAADGVGSGLPSAASSNFLIPEIVTPSKQKRRATVSTRSPEPLISGKFAESVTASASTSNLHANFQANLHAPGSANTKAKRNASQSTLAKLGIMPLALQDADYKKSTDTLPRLADVVDRSLFIAAPYTSRDNLADTSAFTFAREPSYDDLQASICHVEPYPSRNQASGKDVAYPDTPYRQKMENVYDRFLMTSGVKRNGKGYQSEAPVVSSNTLGVSSNNNHKRESFRPFGSSRRPMPPPVSSEDIIEKIEKRQAGVSVDELGLMTGTGAAEGGSTPLGQLNMNNLKEEGHGTVALVRRAFKAMVPGNRRLSRAY